VERFLKNTRPLNQVPPIMQGGAEGGRKKKEKKEIAPLRRLAEEGKRERGESAATRGKGSIRGS